VLGAAERTALVTVTDYAASGGAETAEVGADIVLAAQNDRLYVFTRDPENPERLVSQGLDEREVIELVRSLAEPDGGWGTHSTVEPAPSGRIAKLGTTIMRRLRRDQPAASS
jgi:hypothetical protein